MLLSHRRRRGSYALAETEGLPRAIRILVRVAIILLVAYAVGSWLLRLLGVGTRLERAGATLTVPDTGTVTVAVDGGEWQRAQDGMKVYAGESVSTGSNGSAILQFFDDSVVRLDERTQVTIAASGRGTKRSVIALTLKDGALWASTPEVPSSGVTSETVVRTVEAGRMSLALPGGVEAVATPAGVAVFRARGEGVSLKLAGYDPIVVGEGQKWTLPERQDLGELAAYRSALNVADLRGSFLLESRRARAALPGRGALPDGPGTPGEEILSVTEPAAGATANPGVVNIAGKVGPEVASVSVNGHPAALDKDARAFTQQATLDEAAEELEIRIEAFDADGNLLAEVVRVVARADRDAPDAVFPPPTITTPAESGRTFRTQQEEVVLRGTSPEGAIGIMVNDYELKLFNPEKRTWSYLASTRLGNLLPGRNVYQVVALYGEEKRRSAPVELTVLWGEGAEGVVEPADPSSLPQNAPLEPGTLRVTAPVAGILAVLSGTGTLIEGETSPATAAIWVNNYRLQLYRPGTSAWNYIAEPALKNLKPGTNAYIIIARNAKNEVLDTLTYTIEYEP